MPPTRPSPSVAKGSMATAVPAWMTPERGSGTLGIERPAWRLKRSSECPVRFSMGAKP